MCAACSQRRRCSSTISIGIDVHKKRCVAVLKDGDGRLLEELSFENTSEGVDRLIERARKHGGEARAVVESSANYWVRIHARLEENHIETLLANPLKTRLIAEAKIKTDRLDASTLADLLRANLIAESYVPPKPRREQRALVRHRAYLVKMRTGLKNRIHALLDKHELRHGYSDLFGRAGMTWLEALDLPGVDKTILRTSLAVLKALDAEIQEVTARIAEQACQEEDVKLLMTMPGIDFYTALLIASEIGEIGRFSTPWKLVGYAGLAPGRHQSAGKQWSRGITKQGSRWLRWSLVQAAQVARRHDARFQAYYERIARRRGPQKAAVAVAKEMLVVIWHMLTNREAYRGRDEVLVARKFRRMARIGGGLPQTPSKGMEGL